MMRMESQEGVHLFLDRSLFCLHQKRTFPDKERGMSYNIAEILRYAAFTKDGTGGNPAGVVLDASGLSSEEMQTIAAQVGYSETAFITERREAGRITVRYFSPLAEVPFCGHATIALSAAFAEREGAAGLILTTNSGQVVVDIQRDKTGTILATLTSVPTHTREASREEVGLALKALRWTAEHLDRRYPIHVAYGGAEHLIVAVKDRRTLAALDYDYPALATLMAQKVWTTIHIIWAETPILFHARDPFPPGGVREDPATGAAAAAFGGYLRALGLVNPPTTVTIHQGDDNGTPSLLILDLLPNVLTVRVTGTASPIRTS
jgi:PhzF family phenazine biosynthesis protein